MSKAIQSTIKSNPDNSRHGLFHKIIFVLRHGLKRNHKFLDLFPYLKIFFPWRSGSFIALTILLTAAFSIWCSTNVSAASLTLSITNPSAIVNLVVASQDGTFASSTTNSNDIAFSVTSTNPTGYTLSIAGNNDDGLLSGNKNNSFSSITSATSESVFSSHTTLNGKWGYKPNKLNSATNTNYLPAPTTDATVLDETTAANTTANNYTIAVGARADYSMTTMDYTNTFQLIAVSNPLPVFIQDYDYATCATEAIDNDVMVTDVRDGNVYTVRYINGDCWMMQDLNIEAGVNMTSADSNVISDYTIPLEPEYPNLEGEANCSDGGCSYNYTAASAGTIAYENNSGNDFADYNAKYDICPKGWRMPENSDLHSEFPGNYYSDSAWTSTGGYDFVGLSTFFYSDGILNLSSSAEYQYDYNRVRCIHYKPGIILEYNNNGGTGLMDSQAIEYGKTVTLYDNKFTRDGYVFAGWNTSASGDGVAYQNGASFSAPPSEEEGQSATLYAQWVPIIGYMQDIDSTICSTNASSKPAAAIDRRDSNIYTIRYIGNKCWMTQNLRLAGNTTLTPSDSNVASDFTLPMNIYNSSFDEWNYSSPRITCDSSACQSNSYNYVAATAGTINAEAYSDDGRDTMEAQYSLCPSGWRMPSKEESNGVVSYKSFFSQYGWWTSTTYSSEDRWVIRTDGDSFSLGASYRYNVQGLTCVID